MIDSAVKTEHHGAGHHASLRKRLLEKNGESLYDHELSNISSRSPSRAATPSRSQRIRSSVMAV